MPAEKLIQFVVVTPERQVLEETAQALVIPAHDGELGILRDRAPLICELGVGHLRYRRNGVSGHLFVDGGFAEVLNNQVVIVTERAARPEEIDDELISQAQRAAAAVPPDYDSAEARERARRRVAALTALRASP